MFKRIFVVSSLSVLALASACTAIPNKKTGQYWQRISASDSVYLRGPKAQEMLNRDIARCVTELRELERLGQVRNAIPADTTGRVLDPDELETVRRNDPEYDGALLAEQKDYQDFEGCMYAGGWERAVTIPFEGLERSEDNYRSNHVDYRKSARDQDRRSQNDNFNDLNK